MDRGLQHASPLARLLSLSLLQALLQRLYHFVVQLEDASTANFYDNRDALIQDAMKTLPDIQTVLNIFKSSESREPVVICIMKYYCMLFAHCQILPLIVQG